MLPGIGLGAAEDGRGCDGARVAAVSGGVVGALRVGAPEGRAPVPRQMVAPPY